MSIVIAREDPNADDIVAVLDAHLALMHRISPPGHVHALDLDGLRTPNVEFLTARRAGEVLGVGALKSLGSGRAEVKSMHTVAAARGAGVGRLLLDEIIDRASAAGVTWLGLETGTQPEFVPARRMYESYGFVRCDPFDDYTVNPHSVCMSLALS